MEYLVCPVVSVTIYFRPYTSRGVTMTYFKDIFYSTIPRIEFFIQQPSAFITNSCNININIEHTANSSGNLGTINVNYLLYFIFLINYINRLERY